MGAQDKQPDKMIVVYVCDEGYFPYFKISAQSVLRYNKNVEIIVLSKNVLPKTDFEYRNLLVNTNNFKFRCRERFKETVYYKLYLPLLDFDKVLFLDCDTICQRPLNDLWNEPCDFITVTESHAYGKVQAAELGVPKYGLTGMMVLNLKALREERFTEKCLEYIKSHNNLSQHEETIINRLYNNRLKFVDVKYNYCRQRHYINPILESDAYILHYVGANQKLEMLKFNNFFNLDPIKQSLEGQTVAIVGNAKSIFDKQYGNDIDSHDIIIRFNRGMVINKESQGTKTDIVFLVCGLTPEELKQYGAKYIINRNPRLNNMQCPFTLTAYDKFQYKQGTKMPSTGFIAVNFVLGTGAKRIDLYGFDFFKGPTYYNPVGQISLHNGVKEEEKLLELEKFGLIKIYR